MKSKAIKADEPQQVSDKETEILLELLQETFALDGDIVELGCYRGDTSILFEKELENFLKQQENQTESQKHLWIYDSFEGLPPKTKEDSSVAGDQFKSGELLVTKREVIEKFKRHGLKIPKIKKGFFENLDPKMDLPEKICFAFCDGDLYQSIKTSLKLIENKMSKNGIIVVHDYNNPELPGSARAVDEWLKSHPKKTLTVRETLAIIR